MHETQLRHVGSSESIQTASLSTENRKSSKKDLKPCWDRQHHTTTAEEFSKLVLLYSETGPVQPTHSMGHDLLQELLMLALDVPSRVNMGTFALL